jgi:hypothetical protein
LKITKYYNRYSILFDLKKPGKKKEREETGKGNILFALKNQQRKRSFEIALSYLLIELYSFKK